MSGGTASIVASGHSEFGHLQVHNLSKNTIFSSGVRSAGCSRLSSMKARRRRGGFVTSYRPPVSCVGSPSPICLTCTRSLFKRPRCYPVGLGLPRSLAEMLTGSLEEARLDRWVSNGDAQQLLEQFGKTGPSTNAHL